MTNPIHKHNALARNHDGHEHDRHGHDHNAQDQPVEPGAIGPEIHRPASMDDARGTFPPGAPHEHPGDAPAAQHAGHGTDHSGHELLFRNRFWVCLVLTIPVLIYSEMIQHFLGFRPPAFPGSMWVAPVLSVAIFAYGGLPFLSMARDELAVRKPGMMTLISLAITVAFVYSVADAILGLGESFFWELVTLIDIMLLGHWLEMRSVRQASGALDELAKLLPDTAERLDTSGQPVMVPMSALVVGDRVLVRPGASVPADGEVFEGETAVDESMITGESKPVHKHSGERVIAGTVNSGDGSLRVVVTAAGESTALAGIMRLVDEAQRSRSQTQLLADRAAALLFWVALGAAALTGLIWIVATGFNNEALLRVVTVLVIACPHALGLAVPLVVALTTSMAARSGMLIRDRRSLENARLADIVVFDKTGTLTEGKQGVVAIATAGIPEREALALAAAVEGDSEHMVARAIRQRAADAGSPLPAVTGFEAQKGRGVSAEVDGRRVYVGGPRLLESLSPRVPAELSSFAEAAGSRGESVVYLVREGEALAAFATADVVRPESQAAVAELKQMGVEVAMITGDSEAVAKAVAGDLGIERVFAQVLPEDKERHVRALQDEGKRVIMVGDGVNDAPALARADVGVAIGSGTDVAVESAGIILVRSDPTDIVHLIRLSRASYRKMVQNIWWAAGYNIIAIPLAAGILAPWGILPPPALGAALMSLSTIVVAINAQTLRTTEL